MKTEIYYFTGTRNSLAVAKEIQNQIGGKLTSISSTADQNQVKLTADAVGIVFPCYLAQKNGIPLIVQRFVQRMIDFGSRYIFAVCTCGGLESVNALPTIKRLKRLLKQRGGRLSGEFSIHLPMNNEA